MPKQIMSLRNKMYKQPSEGSFSSGKKLLHAEFRGRNAWKLYSKSISDNPYKSGALHDAWKKGYLAASSHKADSQSQRAAEGREERPIGIINVKKTSRKKFKIKDTVPQPRKEQPFNYWLGYISPPKKKFRRWTRNPPKPKIKEE